MNYALLIVTHNHARYLPRLIESIKNQNYKNTYFCDAASTDGSAEIIESRGFQSQILKKTKLESFSKNNNDLIRVFNLRPDVFILLNPDTYFEIDFISPILSIFEENQKIGIACPQLINFDGSLQDNIRSYPGLHGFFKNRLGIEILKDNKPRQSQNYWCLGACMFIRANLTREGDMLLDERYRLYCEDSDVCFNAIQEGYIIKKFPDLCVYHDLQEESRVKILSKKNFWNIQSIFKFLLKWNFKYFPYIFSKS
ncbi:glycosyltransferase [Spirochaeta lutea]|uniref:Glycosyltransferase 2-like domain-containing protein n=1 Tax=Spirochaeta lutea TaxID=1480694 RepID=A0A098QU40_9SPIO|nr:glycosyltransferase family 2 protein [Spirochaeta lutea]KGE71121.1 hypothetical protein DC28_12790 [Spirochaeta lutea]